MLRMHIKPDCAQQADYCICMHVHTQEIYIRDGNLCAQTNIIRFVWHTIKHREHLAIFTF